MLTSHPSASVQYRDLHVGGLGTAAAGALASVPEPVLSSTETWLARLRDAVRDADDFVHTNLWPALAVAALVGLTAGYLITRRSRS